MNYGDMVAIGVGITCFILSFTLTFILLEIKYKKKELELLRKENANSKSN